MRKQENWFNYKPHSLFNVTHPGVGYNKTLSTVTKGNFDLTFRYRKQITKCRSGQVGWPGKARGAIAFALTFFVSFFCQEKKERK